MEYLPSYRDGLYVIHTMTNEEFEANKFGLPKQKKYPMPDADHVKSAIKFFNYVTPSNEKELATAILSRMEEYGISSDSINVGDENRFKKYLEESYLEHHGILGQRWGVRRYQNPDGSLTNSGKERYSSKKSDDNDKKLSKSTKTKIAIGAAIAVGILGTYGLYRMGITKTANKAMTDAITDKILRNYNNDVAFYKKTGLLKPKLSKSEYLEKNLKSSIDIPKNKELVNRLVKDQMNTDFKNAGEQIKYGKKKVRKILGDPLAFGFRGDIGSFKYKSLLEKDPLLESQYIRTTSYTN